MYKYPMGRDVYNQQAKRLKLAYGVIAVLAVALALASAFAVQQARADDRTIKTLSAANERLKNENNGLHHINNEIGKERLECIDWLERIQPGINFDGI